MADDKPEDHVMPDVQLEQALARIREGDKIDREAEAMIGSTRAQAALEALRAELPLDATGPFVRKVAHLASDRAGPESERAEADVIEIPAQPNAELPRAKIMIQPVGVNPHVTAPSLAKRAELGVDLVDVPSKDGGVTAGGRTMRLGVSGAAASGVAPEAEPERPRGRSRRSVGLWTGVIVVLAGTVPLLVHRMATTNNPTLAEPESATGSPPEPTALAMSAASRETSDVASSQAPPDPTSATPRAPSSAPRASARPTSSAVKIHDHPTVTSPSTASPVPPPSASAATKPWLQ